MSIRFFGAEFFILYRMLGKTWRGVFTPGHLELRSFPSPTTQQEKREVSCGELCFHLGEEQGCELHLWRKSRAEDTCRSLPPRCWLQRLQPQKMLGWSGAGSWRGAELGAGAGGQPDPAVPALGRDLDWRFLGWKGLRRTHRTAPTKCTRGRLLQLWILKSTGWGKEPLSLYLKSILSTLEKL